LEGIKSAEPARAKRWRVGIWTTIALCALAILFGHTSLAWGFPRFLAYTHAGGWRATAQQVDTVRARIQNETGQEPFVLGMEKYTAAEVGFYLRQPYECVNTYALGAQGLAYRYWTDLGKFEGRPAVAVLPKPTDISLDQLRLHFDHVGEPEHFQAPGARHRESYLINCAGLPCQGTAAFQSTLSQTETPYEWCRGGKITLSFPYVSMYRFVVKLQESHHG